MIQIRKAERSQAKLRVGIAGPSGSGKTMSALKLARGISPEGKIVLIDTERGSGDLYSHLFNYDIITLQPPYAPKNYVEAISLAEDEEYDVIIIDSLSHAWADEGGLLDQADKKAAKGGNRFTSWADLTPQHRSLVGAMLNSPADIIATVRSKQEYAMERDEKTGKSSVKKLGMAPVQREGMEYEFTVFFDLEMNHAAHTSKDRTNLFKDEVFIMDEKIGERLAQWRSEGKKVPPTADEIKRKIMVEWGRIGMLIPNKADEGLAYMRQYVPKLTQVEWKGENATLILATLKTLTPERAKELSEALKAPVAPGTEKGEVGVPVITYPEDEPEKILEKKIEEKKEDVPFGNCDFCKVGPGEEHKIDCPILLEHSKKS